MSTGDTTRNMCINVWNPFNFRMSQKFSKNYLCFQGMYSKHSLGNVKLLLFLNKSIYLWLRWVFVAVRRLSLVAASRGYFVAVHGLLTVVASLVVEHGL